MKNNQFYIGIDVSKLWFDASLLPVYNHVKQAMETSRFTNDKDGLKSFDKWLKKSKVSYGEQSLVVIENTGIYHRLLWQFCSEKNLPIHIGNAAHIKWSFGIARGKNDVVDSKRLCLYACKESDALKATQGLKAELLQLKDLVTCRTKLLKQLKGIERHLGELKTVNTKSIQAIIDKAHKQAIEGMKASIQEIEKQIKEIIKADDQMSKNYQFLISVPGIGHITAVYLICCTANFSNKISGKQLTCYAGVAPFGNTSGSSVKGRDRVHKMANKELKSMLHMCALSTLTRYPELIQYYERKKKEGKHALSIMNAIKNKIVLRAAAVIQNQSNYVDNYVSQLRNLSKKDLLES